MFYKVLFFYIYWTTNAFILINKCKTKLIRGKQMFNTTNMSNSSTGFNITYAVRKSWVDIWIINELHSNKLYFNMQPLLCNYIMCDADMFWLFEMNIPSVCELIELILTKHQNLEIIYIEFELINLFPNKSTIWKICWVLVIFFTAHRLL